MSNEQQDPKDLDEAWNDFMEARTRLLQLMLDSVRAAQQAFDGRIWITFGYPDGMKGCGPHTARITSANRRQ